jgi:hypothetical protein
MKNILNFIKFFLKRQWFLIIIYSGLSYGCIKQWGDNAGQYFFLAFTIIFLTVFIYNIVWYNDLKKQGLI